MKTIRTDVALIGGGIMSATLGSMLKQLTPAWNVTIIERLDVVGAESSNPWNNAGTGHAAFCELNYTPEKDGKISPAKALEINEQFLISRQYWSHLVTNKIIKNNSFINQVAHMSFVHGEDHQKYLRKRFNALHPHTLFSSMEYSEDPSTIQKWAPLLIQGRPPEETVAATYVPEGTDVDFGNLTNQLVDSVKDQGTDIILGAEVTNLTQESDKSWTLTVKNRQTGKKFLLNAGFVFVGAGGGALDLLQKSGISEAKGFGGFPVGGQFLKCTNPNIVKDHDAKVYGQAAVGAPPMSVPHLDTRFVDGQKSLLFGPYATFSTKFLKTGSYADLPMSISMHNVLPMLAVGKDNMSLTSYLVKEVLKSRKKQDLSLYEYYPEANPEQWSLINAGQRVQVIKKDPKKGGILQFGTEVITSADGTLSGLLGASPGASTAVPIMLKLLDRCFPHEISGWKSKLTAMIPSFGTTIDDKPALATDIEKYTSQALGLTAHSDNTINAAPSKY